MPTRRSLLAAFGGSIGTYAGLDATDSGYGSIQWGDEEVQVRTVVRADGGLLGDPRVVYESEHRIFPTEHTRGGDTNRRNRHLRGRRRGRPPAVTTSG